MNADLQRYVVELCRVAPLSRDEQLATAARAAAGDAAARELLIMSMMRMVVSVVVRYSVGYRGDPRDLMQAGAVAVMEAVDAYDPSRKCLPSSWCQFVTYRKVRQAVMEEGGSAIRSILVPSALGDDLVDPDAPDPQAGAEARLASDRLSAALWRLCDADRAALEARYGLDGPGGTRTLQEVGELLGYSKQRAKQVLDRAMDRLRFEMQSRDP